MHETVCSFGTHIITLQLVVQVEYPFSKILVIRSIFDFWDIGINFIAGEFLIKKCEMQSPESETF